MTGSRTIWPMHPQHGRLNDETAGISGRPVRMYCPFSLMPPVIEWIFPQHAAPATEMTASIPRSLLKNLDLFRTVPDKDLDTVLSIAKAMRLTAGEPVFQQGEAA